MLNHDYTPTECHNDCFGGQSADGFGTSDSSSRIPQGLHPGINKAIFYPDVQTQPVASASGYALQGSLSSAAPCYSDSTYSLRGLELLEAVGCSISNQSNSQNLSYDIASSFKQTREAEVTTVDVVKSSPRSSSNHNNSKRSPSDARRFSSTKSLVAPRKKDLESSELDTKQSSHDAIMCQWANDAGQPCGKYFKLADDLHDHLREAHNTKSSLFCRWIGCSVSELTPHPHRYANSVQRHTWGHSGYRPYKCSACGEGFAAANVRDEHFSNIHLNKKMFACDVCDHQCSSATNLKRHKDERHRAERFQCEFCNRNGKIRLFPRGQNLARHFRKCKFVLASFPEAKGSQEGKIEDTWYPPGYKKGHHGMNRAKITPPKYLTY